MPCQSAEQVLMPGGMFQERMCGTLTVFTKPDAFGVQRRICRAHMQEQREAATA